MSSPGIGRLADLLVGVAATAFVVVLAWSDRADGDHALWRDPISYFGAADAPHSLAFQVALVCVGLTAGLWVATRARQLPMSVAVLGWWASVSVVGLGLWPIDCSPVDDLCEVFIRARVVSRSHNVHSVFAVSLFASLAVLAALAAIGVRSPSKFSRRRRVTTVASAAIAVVAGGVVLLLPFAAGAGLAEAVAVAATAMALRASRNGLTQL